MSDESIKKKWWRRRWVFWCLWMPTGLLGLIYVVFAWLGWRERKLWNETLAQLDERGESVDLADYMPADVPDDENVLADKWFIEILNKSEAGQDGLSTMMFGIKNSDKAFSEYSYLQASWGAADPRHGLLLKVAQDEDNDRIARMSNKEAARFLLNALDANSAISGRIQNLLSRPAWHSKIPDEPLEFFDEDQRYFAIIELARFYAKEAMMRSMVDDIDGACRALDSSIRVLKLAKTHQVLIGQLVEITCEGIVQCAVWQLIVTHGDNTQILDKLDEVIASCNLTGDGMIDALRAEAAYGIAAIQAAHKNGMTSRDFGIGNPGIYERFAAHLIESDLVAYRTMRTIVELRNFEIRRFEETSPRLPINQLGLMLDDAAEKRAASKNVIGKMIESLGIYVAGENEIFVTNQASVVANTVIGKCQVSVARFKLDEGRYPTGFSELVPNYIDAVPTDPFDGKPLRWTSDKSGKPLIYSIGPDLVDDGGVALDDDKQGDIRWLMTVQGVNDENGYLEGVEDE